jgi:hypothetical protein
MAQVEHTIALFTGYTDKEGKTHKSATFGRRLTGNDLFNMNEDDDFGQRTKSQLMIMAAAITQFGGLPIPAPLTVLLSLNRADRLHLTRGYNRFLELSATGRKVDETHDPATVKLAFGFERVGTLYDVAKFGNLVDGYTEVEADKFQGWRRTCFLLGKEIAELSQSDGQETVKGPIPLEMFGMLDASDIFALTATEVLWLDSMQTSEGVE